MVLLPKSSGVVKRNETQRFKNRNTLIHNYFYGLPKSPFHPFKIELKFEDISIYSILKSSSSSSITVNKSQYTTLLPLKPIPSMKNHLLSVSLAKVDQNDVVQTNIAGFLHMWVTNEKYIKLD